MNADQNQDFGVPKGLDENSPAFQRRGAMPTGTSPEGTAELCVMIQPSLRDFGFVSFDPALKRRAIFIQSLRDVLESYAFRSSLAV